MASNDRYVTELTPYDMHAAMQRMQPKEMAFFRQLAREGEPGEAEVFLEFFHYFPGVRMEDVPEKEQALPKPQPINPQTMEIPF